MKLTVHILKNCCSLLLLVALGFSCKKESKASVNETQTQTVTMLGTNSSLTAKLNDKDWTSVKTTAVLEIDRDNKESSLMINAETTDDAFVFYVDFENTSANLVKGEHDFNGPKFDMTFVYKEKVGFVNRLCDGGTLNITAVDNTNKRFSGTFSFTMHNLVMPPMVTDSIKVRNGLLTNIPFVVQ